MSEQVRRVVMRSGTQPFFWTMSATSLWMEEGEAGHVLFSLFLLPPEVQKLWPEKKCMFDSELNG